MAIRAQQVLQYALIKSYNVVAANVTIGQVVKQSGADLSVTPLAAVTDFAIGVALDDGLIGATVRVALFGGGLAKVKVGTGGATRGNPAKFVANGVTNAVIGGATTALFVCGQFIESPLLYVPAET